MISTQLEISFDFKTVRQNGVIISTSNTYSGIAIEMYQGKVRHLQNMVISSRSSPQKFCPIFTKFSVLACTFQDGNHVIAN